MHFSAEAGTRYVWVVHLTGPRRVEVHARNQFLHVAYPGTELTAPGVLANPVLVEALYDPTAAHEAALRNLLQRRGYRDLNAVLEKGREEGREEGKLALVLLQLRRALGQIPEDMRYRLGHLGRDDLDRLASDLLDFNAIDDLAAWLARTPSR